MEETKTIPGLAATADGAPEDECLEPRGLSDEAFGRYIEQFARNVKGWQRRFGGFLPEANRRGWHRRHGCSSTIEYAAKRAGMSLGQTRDYLRLDELLVKLPALRRLLESGQVARAKLRSVSGVATADTEEVWADKVRTLSRQALDALVRQWREQEARRKEKPKPKPVQPRSPKGRSHVGASLWEESVPALPPAPPSPPPERRASEEVPDEPGPRPMVAVRLDCLTAERLYKVAEGLGRERGVRVSATATVEALLDGYNGPSTKRRRYEEVIFRSGDNGARWTRTRWGDVAVSDADIDGLERKGDPIDLQEEARALGVISTEATSRYVPAAIKRHLHHRYGGFCAFPGCNRPAEVLHHVKRFALQRYHDWQSVVPLCKAHDELAHAGLVANEGEDAATWLLRLKRSVETADEAARARIDAKVARARKASLKARDGRSED